MMTIIKLIIIIESQCFADLAFVCPRPLLPNVPLAVCSSFLIGAATTGMMVMMVMMNTILMVVMISIMSNYTASAKVT